MQRLTKLGLITLGSLLALFWHLGMGQTAYASSRLEQQLKTAVESRHWTEAIAIVDKLLVAEPKRASQLQLYRQQLVNLQTQANTRDEKTLRSLYSRLNLGLRSSQVVQIVGVTTEASNRQLLETYRWEIQDKKTLQPAATFDIEFVDGKMVGKKLTTNNQDFQKKFRRLEVGMTYKKVRSTIANPQTDGQLLNRTESFDYRWIWQTPSGGQTSLLASFANDQLRQVQWNFEGRIQERVR